MQWDKLLHDTLGDTWMAQAQYKSVWRSRRNAFALECSRRVFQDGTVDSSQGALLEGRNVSLRKPLSDSAARSLKEVIGLAECWHCKLQYADDFMKLNFDLFGDSKLVIQMLSGLWRNRTAGLAPLTAIALRLLQAMRA